MRKQSADGDGKRGREKDALARYRDKRDPAATTEPFSAERKASGATYHGDFVVHLHDATRRHYDLRIQVGGTLKSFAVPKGPSLDPREKRLAVNTEDHPLEYLEFEEVIPQGNYGAGSMIVWDLGRVIYLEGSAEEGIARGKIDFALNGHKLHGRFALVHTGARHKPGDPEAQHWLLLKKTDAHSRQEGDITEQEPLSVLSGLAVDELADAKRIAAELRDEAAKLGAPTRDLDCRKLTPMLCSSEGAELKAKGWIYELKLDGVRIVADRHDRNVELRYRGGRSATASYPEIARAVRSLPVERVVLDGEIVAFDESGRPDFQRLARRIHLRRPSDVRQTAHEVPVSYLVFDLLQLGDRDLTSLPLSQRKRLLSELIKGRGLLRTLPHLQDDGSPLLAFCEENDLEGLVAKRGDSRYRPGPKRTSDWVKVKREREADLVVVGWEESEKARKLRSLLVAAYDGDRLVLRGKVGSGLDDATIDLFLELLPKMAVKRCPAEGKLTRHGKRHYVRPDVVVNVAYAGTSDSGTLRFPVFRGVRADVPPSACVLVPSQEHEARALDGSNDEPVAPSVAVRAAQVAVRAQLTNQQKVFWPAEGLTKGDLCDYYASVGEVLVPLLAHRPIVLVRYPDGIEGKSFFQWHVPKGTPDWVRSIKVRDEGERNKREKRTFLIEDVDGLLHIANLGCIPIHILAARENSLDCCDFLTVDFDVGEQPLRDAVTLALALRELLGDLGLTGFPKTSGQSGLHVLVPLGPGVSFDTAKVLVELLGRILVARHPDIATMERVKDKRGAKIYVDTGQTGRSRTIVAPYSVRAVPGAGVSTPLWWDEVHMALDPGRFTILTVPDRLRELGDPMADLLLLSPDVASAVTRIGELLGQ